MKLGTLPSFFVIWTGQAFSLIGSSVAQFALVWWLTQLTGSATVLATATMAAMVPGIILGPIAGAYVDRWNRRTVMIIADGLVALAALWLAYMFWSGAMQPWHVYVIVFIRALGGTFHWPAMQASTSLMVPKEHLTRVAGLNQTMHGVINITAPPLGALLLALLPLHGIMLLDVGTALLAISTLLLVHVPQPQRLLAVSGAGPGANGQKASIWVDVREGLRYVWHWPGILAVLVMAVLINFLLAPSGALLPLLVTKYFHGQAPQLAGLQSAWGIGVILGGLSLGVWGGFKRRVYTSLLALALMGLGFITIGLTPATAFWLAVVGNLVAGFMNPLVNGPLFAILQTTVAPEMQGRVFTVIVSLSSAMTPLSLAIAGPVADVVGVRPWFVMGGVLCVLMGLGACFVPVIVNLEKNNGSHEAVAQVEKSWA
ncbi:MAG: MFS transporter [Chloroflexi bacterium]|nr:MFS transporter [Chloroflexota bacterium]